MEEFTLQELGYFLVMLLGAIGGTFHIVQRSRCTRIQSCCVTCERNVKNMPLEKPSDKDKDELQMIDRV